VLGWKSAAVGATRHVAGVALCPLRHVVGVTLYPRSGSDALPPETRSGSDALNVFERLKRKKRRRAYGRRAPTGLEKKETAAGKRRRWWGRRENPDQHRPLGHTTASPPLIRNVRELLSAACHATPHEKRKTQEQQRPSFKRRFTASGVRAEHTPALKMSAALEGPQNRASPAPLRADPRPAPCAPRFRPDRRRRTDSGPAAPPQAP
jgi:hypothetical protein